MKSGRRVAATAALVVGVAFAVAEAFATDYYVDSKKGSDAASGTSPDEAWKTLRRVSNAKEIVGGDVVRFRSGRVWREGLAPRSGEKDKPVTYTSYGRGQKPSFWRSVSLAEEKDWIDEGDNIWSTRPTEIKEIGNARELEPASWRLHHEQGADVALTQDAGNFTLECLRAGTSASHIQWYYAPFKVRGGEAIRFSFKASATKPTNLNVSLMGASSPWPSYGSVSGVEPVSSDIKEYQIYLQPNRDADDARLTFYLGVMPEGAKLEIFDLKFEDVKIDGLDLSPDVGNIILDGSAAAFKRWKRDELKTQGDFYYDCLDGRVRFYSEKNPARAYKSLEAARMLHVINLSGVHDAVFDGLDIRYGSAHGFGGSGNERCVIRNCDISWIGGGDQYREGWSGRMTRFGNGIEFWANGRDHLVENCRIWEIYDAAITNQGSGTNEERNIVYRNNLIWNSEYSFEYWNRDETSITDNVQFVDNVCLNAGFGWGHVQRRDPNGRHLMFYSNTARTTNFVVKGNVFANAKDSLVRSDIAWTPEEPNLDGNAYWQDDESIPYFLWHNKKYSKDEFAEFQKDSGREANGEIRRIDVEKALKNPKSAK